ncbi:hypothetical protein [Falsiroseomonas selenitidurans]|uniref:Uncharacterized protein n=1 Tax=Falsiroseomonas selenitidurans TaxID=2716335 RepID=A0ABX1DZK0_9PROT|nr:hypothetical protein [Falsiroseomonas selenitidurans]NKC29805.1 hypothetical protein [Falsiroseomonas selenitidurans]
MPFADQRPEPADLARFQALCGARLWQQRLGDLAQRTASASLSGRAAQQRHALELVLARLADPRALARATPAERLACAFAREAVQLAERLPAAQRARLRAQIAAGLTGEATLMPLFHLLRTAALHRSRGFDVTFAGLAEDASFDLLIEREGVAAEVVCETVSAEEGREVHRGDWCALVDKVNPELQTWLAAHPGRYLLKMTLPGGMATDAQVAELHGRIAALLAAQKRQDSSAEAVLKLDPLVLAGAQAAGRALPAQLRAQFGEEAHLAVTATPGSGSVFVMAARAGRENSIAAAVTRRCALVAESRLSGTRPGLLAMFVEDVDRAEWRALRERLELEGAARRWMTEPAARHVVAVACTSRMELFGVAPPDGAAEGELRFRNPGHPAGKSPALAPAVASSV